MAEHEATRKIQAAQLVCHADACWTPDQSAIVPCTITADLSASISVCPSVLATELPVFTLASVVPACAGNGWTGGGVSNGAKEDRCWFKTSSTTVFAEGQKVCRDGDDAYMNDGNALGKCTYFEVGATPTITITLDGQITGNTDPPIKAETPAEKARMPVIQPSPSDLQLQASSVQGSTATSALPPALSCDPPPGPAAAAVQGTIHFLDEALGGVGNAMIVQPVQFAGDGIAFAGDYLAGAAGDQAAADRAAQQQVDARAAVGNVGGAVWSDPGGFVGGAIDYATHDIRVAWGQGDYSGAAGQTTALVINTAVGVAGVVGGGKALFKFGNWLKNVRRAEQQAAALAKAEQQAAAAAALAKAEQLAADDAAAATAALAKADLQAQQRAAAAARQDALARSSGAQARPQQVQLQQADAGGGVKITGAKSPYPPLAGGVTELPPGTHWAKIDELKSLLGGPEGDIGAVGNGGWSIDRVAGAIEAGGFDLNGTILVAEADPTQVVDGMHRLEALKRLGYTHAPVRAAGEKEVFEVMMRSLGLE